MFRLGLRLTLKSGKEAFVRLVVTSLAVAIGVAILLSVLAEFHAFQTTSNRPSWESTQPMQGQNSNPANVELWNYSENIYKGQFIEQLDVAALSSKAPVISGIPKLPSSGQYYASPALVKLLAAVPKGELGNRFNGTKVGTIGEKALSSPNELAIVIGYTPAQISKLPNTIKVNKIADQPQLQGTTNIYKIAFGIGAVAILFPILILINTATRISAARREERYAAMRLVGATPRQINVIASVEAIIGALFGAVIGIGVYLLIHSVLTSISLSGVGFFADYVTPTIWGYIGMLIIVPIAAALASLVSLRRVQISPLGVSRKAVPPSPKAWRIIPLAVGLVLFVYFVTTVNTGHPLKAGVVIFPFILVLAGLVIGGSWLTMQASWLLAKYAKGASSLLAARRLADNPKAAFRSVSGLVLAVFIGTIIAVFIPALQSAESPGPNASLTNVLRMEYLGTGQKSANGLTPQSGSMLISKLQSYSGVTIIPIYTNPSFNMNAPPPSLSGTENIGKSQTLSPNNTANSPYDSIISCSALSQLPVLGTCTNGAKALFANFSSIMYSDNPISINNNIPVVNGSNPSVSNNFSGLYLGGILVKSNNPNTLEKVRTYITTFNTSVVSSGNSNGASLSGWQMGSLEPETFGEMAQIRNNDATNIERVVLAIVGITLLVAGCSLAVTVGGSLVERKRPFTLLRLSGAQLSTLYKVVIMEAVLPLITASVVAASVGYGVSGPLINAFNTRAQTHGHFLPSLTFYLVLGAGFIISLLIILATLPLLNRMTDPDNARFE